MNWDLRPTPDLSADKFQELQNELGFGPLAIRVGVGRGLKTAQEFRSWLEPKLSNLPAPSTLLDLDRACEILIQARGSRVRVYGDYDVDGTSGAALLHWGLSQMGFLVDVQQPDRFKDGYGVHLWAIEQAAKDGIKVFVTVDCGITALAPAVRARELDISMIIIDHHQVLESGELPQADAVIDPHRSDCTSGLKELCGCALGYFVLIALRARGRALGWFQEMQEPNLRDHLDLVALATAADQVPLLGVNHILMAHGLRVLRRTKKWGLKALVQSSRIDLESVSPADLAFRLGPRINASGRMRHASLACELLISRQERQAFGLAYELEQLNSERMQIQERVWQQVVPRVQACIEKGRFQKAIIVADPEWHEGVVGILASRVVDTFRRPAIVLSIQEGLAKGSVRSDGRSDVLGALRACSDLLMSFGGHRYAAGLRLPPENLEAFIQRFEAALTYDSPEPATWIDGECFPQDLTQRAIEEIESLGPFGQGHPEPLFALHGAPQETRILKEKHFKYVLGRDGHLIEGIWFRGVESQQKYSQTNSFESWLGTPELNRFRGKKNPVFRIRRPAS